MPALSPVFLAGYIDRCGICGGDICLRDAVAYDQDSQLVHDYCA